MEPVESGIKSIDFFFHILEVYLYLKKFILSVIKEKVDSKPESASSKPATYHRRLKSSQVPGEHIFQKEGDILFIQVWRRRN